MTKKKKKVVKTGWAISAGGGTIGWTIFKTRKAAQEECSNWAFIGARVVRVHIAFTSL